VDAKAESWREISDWKETGLENVSSRDQTKQATVASPNRSTPISPILKNPPTLFFFLSLMTSSITQPTFLSPNPLVNIFFSHLVNQLNVIITSKKVFNRYNGLRVEKIGCV